jgi:hypothetical protein
MAGTQIRERHSKIQMRCKHRGQLTEIIISEPVVSWDEIDLWQQQDGLLSRLWTRWSRVSERLCTRLLVQDRAGVVWR